MCVRVCVCVCCRRNASHLSSSPALVEGAGVLAGVPGGEDGGQDAQQGQDEECATGVARVVPPEREAHTGEDEGHNTRHGAQEEDDDAGQAQELEGGKEKIKERIRATRTKKGNKGQHTP